MDKKPPHKLECIDLNPSSSKQEDNSIHIQVYKETRQRGTNGQIYSAAEIWKAWLAASSWSNSALDTR